MGKDVPDFSDIVEMEESHSGNLFDMWFKWHIMVKDDSKVAHSGAGSKTDAAKRN